jgi:hypothetical protein
MKQKEYEAEGIRTLLKKSVKRSKATFAANAARVKEVHEDTRASIPCSISGSHPIIVCI